jgi:hypothetical protein
MRRGWWRARAALVAAASALGVAGSVAHAQDIEPRAYSNAPVGVNFLIGSCAYTRGGLAFDSSVPITDPQLDTRSGVLGCARVLNLGGRSAKFDAIAPYGGLSGTAQYAGQPVERDVQGFGDPRFRLSVNFYGAPALALKDFAAYRLRPPRHRLAVPLGRRTVNCAQVSEEGRDEYGRAFARVNVEFDPPPGVLGVPATPIEGTR